MKTQRLALLAISPIILALAACGNDDTPVITSTSLSGQVVKGPVSASSVCVYAVNAGVKATSTLVPCVTSDAAGNYSFSSISYTGDMVVEATGGTYKDEATAATVALSTPLKTMVIAQGGSTSGMVTPLTTIALSTSSNLTNAAFGQAAANVAAQAGLSGTNILTTAPTYAANGTSASNAYAAALGAIAKYQQTNGATLASTLAAWTPANQAAFQTALNAYASAASVIAANLPAAFNLAATGTAYSFGVSVAAGGGSTSTATGSTAAGAAPNAVTAAGGLIGSSSFTVTGAGGSGFAPIAGLSLSVAGIQTVSFNSFSTTVSLLAVSIEGTGSAATRSVLYVEGSKEWTFECTGAACAAKVAIDATGKSVTLTSVTLTADTSTGATGTVVANGSGAYN
jgi:hypothetical protein